MAPRPAVKIPPETLAAARRLLDRRELFERSQLEPGADPALRDGHMAGLNDALAMLWQGVIDTQNGRAAP